MVAGPRLLLMCRSSVVLTVNDQHDEMFTDDLCPQLHNKQITEPEDCLGV